MTQLKSHNPTVLRNVSSTIYFCATNEEIESVASTGMNIETDRESISGPAHCVITGCSSAHIYLLGPFLSLTISQCVDCEIMVGAVGGAVVLHACDRLILTTITRKLVAVSSQDCRFNIATLTPSLLAGDCKNIVFGN
jgi:hypothetical protein